MHVYSPRRSVKCFFFTSLLLTFSLIIYLLSPEWVWSDLEELLVQVEGEDPIQSTNYATTLPPGPVVLLGGKPAGLGNQLFMYAFAYAFASSLNANATVLLQFDTPWNRKFSPTERKFALDMFSLDQEKFKYYRPLHSSSSGPPPPPLSSHKAIVVVNETVYWEHRIPTGSTGGSGHTNTLYVLDDYWESEEYFKEAREEVRAQFTLNTSAFHLPHRQLISRIQGTQSVAVHFRRADFLNKRNARGLPFTYQLRSMELLQILTDGAALTYFIFSDDIHFVEKELRNSQQLKGPQLQLDLVFVSGSFGLTSIQEFYLMTLCKHFIIANSTFSWWAAYLGRHANKIVIAPYPKERAEWYERFEDEKEKKYKMMVAEKFPYPKGWVTLNPFQPGGADAAAAT